MAICEKVSINLLILYREIFSLVRCLMVCVWMEPLILPVFMMRGCVFIKFAGGGELKESIIAVYKSQILYFGVGCEWGLSIWWDAY